MTAIMVRIIVVTVMAVRKTILRVEIVMAARKMISKDLMTLILHGRYGKKELIMIVMLMMKTFQVIIEILSGKIYF